MTRIEFSDEGYEVVTNVWGEDIPRRLDHIDTDILWDMQHRASTAATEMYRDQDDDDETKLALLMIEAKSALMLSERLCDHDGEGGVEKSDDRPRPTV